MRHETMNLRRCVVRLVVWFFVIQFAGYALSPSLSRTTYPQLIDLCTLALIPIAALHASKTYRRGLPFTIYGALSSSIFWLNYVPTGRIELQMAAEGDVVLYRRLVFATLVTCILIGACRFAVVVRTDWWDEWRAYPPGHCQACGYNLTGNWSGTCPECGTEIDDRESSA